MIALWYASRATGLAALLLLTAVVVTGAAGSARFAAAGWPRFATAALHRNLTLLCLAFLTIHISTAIIDPYVAIAWVDAVVPFASAYHPFSVGLGALALDLLAALVISSLARPAINARAWRVLHWAAYACWPVAVAHGLGVAGADSRLVWVRILTGVCVGAVVAVVGWRARARHPDTQARRRPFQDSPR